MPRRSPAPDTDDFLQRCIVLGLMRPTTLPRSDALRLLDLAGLRDSDAYRGLAAGTEPYVTLSGVREVAERARELAGLGIWPPPRKQ